MPPCVRHWQGRDWEPSSRPCEALARSRPRGLGAAGPRWLAAIFHPTVARSFVASFLPDIYLPFMRGMCLRLPIIRSQSALLAEDGLLPEGAAQWAAHWEAASRIRPTPPPTRAPQPTFPRAADAPTAEAEPCEVTLRHQMLLPPAGSLPTPPAAIVAVALAKAAAEAANATRSRLEEEARVVRKRPRPQGTSLAADRPSKRCQDCMAGGAPLSSLPPQRPPPSPPSPPPPPPSRLLHDQITGLAALAAPDAHEHALRQETAQAYAALVAEAIPGAQVYPPPPEV